MVKDEMENLKETAIEEKHFEVNDIEAENISTKKDAEKSVRDIDSECFKYVRNNQKYDTENESGELITIQDDKKQFQCTFCHKSVDRLSHLKDHERIHTGEVPFECKTCKKRFKTKDSLKIHERIHT